MATTEDVMKKAMLAVLAFAGLAGCVVVPAYDAPVGYAAPPPAVVVRPYFYGGVSYYGGHGWRGYPRRYY
jgi:hypothetical protein